MTFLLDTNAVSEWFKPRPNSGLMAWMHMVDEDRTYVSVITLGELRKGVERLPSGWRRQRLQLWLIDDLRARFEHRVLSVDAETGDAWGRLIARTEKAGCRVGVTDALIAATAEVHALKVVTRNVKHFEPTGVPVLNPWTG
ncbi:type II toxin-antitoxin system VapC family toxin [Phytoactinopolyspora limicola]|uniref:type II toxin-antitoxin system VapC family toxin n=1 Tax=Phytoactinopolyspora limicola TaxID=2715536 RepID=UPI0014098C0E|nr:type II toxin-antitoxin system VapC family toxin [Phytoactinopolyspora limicola]